MKVAVAKYTIDAPASFDVFARKLSAWLDEARVAGADLAVLPEYLSLELAATFEAPVRADLLASLAATQEYLPHWMALFSGEARRTGMHIVAGSFLQDTGLARFRNRSYLFSPDGGHAWQDKLQLTGFEKQAGVIESGDALGVFDLGDGIRAATAICYDSEFPLPVRAQCEAGARLLLVPSCTDTEAGATRVRVGCMARALENRCFVAQSVTAGDAPWSPALDTNTGEAAIYAPMDAGLPADGVLARTEGAQHWAVADLDFEALSATRVRAQVAVDGDWPAQFRPGITRARMARFSR
ncbi:carbon-nitrogen hydrolase family protein [Aerolutibacter ruishenii]|uniref:Putative amidohydrolase n=1 Tax=Aerolutibacter ruishenii TaxID=686800 RepID=A0A562LI92_9GAMM|nr:carbon-nitrogen hydrolase family protein [Lysobacter ruishenii]TWI07360.1 putative amidohydrolase [Lysobacter ruishenii]